MGKMKRHSCSVTLLLVVIIVCEWRQTESASFRHQLKTLSQMGDKITRTMKQSPMYYVKKFLSPSKRPSSYNSPIYNLPLKLISNAKPIGIFQNGHFSHKRPTSSAASNIFKLPLNFLSNGKPTGLTIGAPGSFIQQAMTNVHKYPVSNIIKLPLTFLSNGRPVGLGMGLDQPQLLNNLHHHHHHHHTPSNIFKLPLSFMSNAKPFGVSLKPFFYL